MCCFTAPIFSYCGVAIGNKLDSCCLIRRIRHGDPSLAEINRQHQPALQPAFSVRLSVISLDQKGITNAEACRRYPGIAFEGFVRENFSETLLGAPNKHACKYPGLSRSEEPGFGVCSPCLRISNLDGIFIILHRAIELRWITWEHADVQIQFAVHKMMVVRNV